MEESYVSNAEGILSDGSFQNNQLDESFTEIVTKVINPSRKGKNPAYYHHCCCTFCKRARSSKFKTAKQANTTEHTESYLISTIFRPGREALTREEAIQDFKNWLEAKGIPINHVIPLSIGKRHFKDETKDLPNESSQDEIPPVDCRKFTEIGTCTSSDNFDASITLENSRTIVVTTAQQVSRFKRKGRS